MKAEETGVDIVSVVRDQPCAAEVVYMLSLRLVRVQGCISALFVSTLIGDERKKRPVAEHGKMLK